ncbi:MAG: hypothetical protein QM820_44820 [Minicystis sp.]
MATRSTTSTITNATSSDWTLSSARLDHGVWATNPPNIVKAGSTFSFRAESDGLATGDEGTVIYTCSDGDFQFYFDNPFLGTDGYAVNCPDGYDQRTIQQTGDDQTLTTRCFKIAERTGKRG